MRFSLFLVECSGSSTPSTGDQRRRRVVSLRTAAPRPSLLGAVRGHGIPRALWPQIPSPGARQEEHKADPRLSVLRVSERCGAGGGQGHESLAPCRLWPRSTGGCSLLVDSKYSYVMFMIMLYTYMSFVCYSGRQVGGLLVASPGDANVSLQEVVAISLHRGRPTDISQSNYSVLCAPLVLCPSSPVFILYVYIYIYVFFMPRTTRPQIVPAAQRRLLARRGRVGLPSA